MPAPSSGDVPGDAPLIDPDVVGRVLARALAHGGDVAEVFCEDRRTSGASFDDGRVEELSSGRLRGAGIRVVAGDTTGFAHTADLTEAGLRAAAEAASAVARQGGGGVRTVALASRRPVAPRAVLLPGSVPKATKLELLARADDAARSAGRAIPQGMAAYGDPRRRVQIASSEGVLAEDDQVRTRYSVSCIASGDTGMQTGFESVARTVGFEVFDEVDVAEVAQLAARRALGKLSARPAPSGEVPVVLAGGGGGVPLPQGGGDGRAGGHTASGFDLVDLDQVEIEALEAAGVRVAKNPTEAGELMVEVVRGLS